MERPLSGTPSSLRAVVFDLDGTLVESAPDLHATLVEVTREIGIKAPDLPTLRTLIGDGARVLIRRSLEVAGEPDDPALVDDLFKRFLARYTAVPCRDSFIYEGVPETLDRLAARGLALGVCTNKPQGPTDGLLAALGMTRWFGSVVGGDALPVRKPDAGHVLAVLDQLQATPDQAVMVGDSRNDVLAARAAGMKVVVVTFGYTTIPPHELGADVVIDHFADLPAAIDQLFPVDTA